MQTLVNIFHNVYHESSGGTAEQEINSMCLVQASDTSAQLNYCVNSIQFTKCHMIQTKLANIVTVYEIHDVESKIVSA